MLNEQIQQVICENAQKMGEKYLCMPSGAVHDSVMLTDLARVGMIFIPSIDGRSHVPQENTLWEDIFRGCDLLLSCICTLAGACL